MSVSKKKSVLMIVGDPSADMYGAGVIRELKALHPEINIIGTGGDLMKEAGLDLMYNVRDMSVIGLFEAFSKGALLRRIRKNILRVIEENNISAALLVDYPGFNLYLASILKSKNIPVVYYISPQVWAWRSGRIKKIKERVDRMLVILPFEEELYRNSGVNASFVGHPLLEIIDEDLKKSENIIPWKKSDGPVVALMPGSRKKEIHFLLADMLKAAEIISAQIPDVSFVLPVAQGLDIKSIEALLPRSIDIKLTDGRAREVLRNSDFAVICSGTATLEAAIIGTPFIIIYRLSKLTEFIGRRFLKIHNWGLVNIVAGKEIIPELEQEEVNPVNIASFVVEALKSPDKLSEMRNDLSKIRSMLGERVASARVAAVISEYI
ncbi:MAG: lipid-A-disaccharide synthase [Candidatus Schekmanbacteria bacterium]|nr:lipid-A-disaccharide synthase [Candidatus Schekmanbacteria bacterium]